MEWGRREGIQTLTSTLRRIAPYLLFAALVCLFLWRPIFTGRALLPGDYLARMQPWASVTSPPSPAPQWNPLQWDAIAQYYPWRVFYARSMRTGHIPLWNPHQFCGTPFLANGQSAVLYPPNLLYVVMDPITATTVYAALHLFLALAFMYLLLLELGRSKAAAILGAVTFAFSAFMVLWLELPTFVGAAVWLPLALLLIHRAVERRSTFHGMLAGLMLAMSFLAGHFQIAFYVLLAATLWWLWKLVEVLRAQGQIYATLRVVVPMLGCLAMLALIAAPQVLPTVELARESHRVRDVTSEGYSKFVANAVKPYRLITAFAPRFYGDPSQGTYYLLGNLDGHVGSAADYMEYGMYAGILPILLALIGLRYIRRSKHAGFFAFLAALALLVACGTVINWLFYYVIPGFSALGGPNRMLLLYLFGVAALAACGFDAIVQGAVPAGPRSWKWAAWLMPLIALVILVTALLFASSGLPAPARAAVRVFADLFFASGVLLIARGGADLCKGSFPILAIVLAVADLFAFGINYNPTCERAKVYPETELTTRLKKIAGTNRIAPINPEWSLFRTPDAILPPNAAMVYGLYDVQGYDSLYTRAYKDRLDEIQGRDSSPIENGNMVLVKGYTEELGNIAKYVLSARPLRDSGLELVEAVDGVRIYRIVGARPEPAPDGYRPFSFRFGLYLMLVGVMALGCVGTFRFVRLRKPRR